MFVCSDIPAEMTTRIQYFLCLKKLLNQYDQKNDETIFSNILYNNPDL